MANAGRNTWPALGVLAGIFAWVGASYVARYHLPVAATAGIFSCFVMLLSLVLVPGFSAGRLRRRWLLVAFACIPYLVYAAGTGDFRLSAFLRLLAIAAGVPFFYAAIPVRDPAKFNWQDAVVTGLLIAAVMSGYLRGVWSVPRNLDFMGRLFLTGVAAWCWVFVRPVPELHYSFQVSRQVLAAAALNFASFALIALPAGLLIGFTEWDPRWHGAVAFCTDYLELLLFVALLEETFFRGFLQSLLAVSFGSWWKSQLLVSVVFGLFHILHAPFPNWRYVALATIAGWFYGSAYRNGRSLLASSLTHATVDTVWRTWLTRT